MATTTTTRRSRRTGKTLLEPTGKESESYEAPKLVVPIDPSRDHVQGDPKAILTLVAVSYTHLTLPTICSV